MTTLSTIQNHPKKKKPKKKNRIKIRKMPVRQSRIIKRQKKSPFKKVLSSLSPVFLSIGDIRMTMNVALFFKPIFINIIPYHSPSGCSTLTAHPRGGPVRENIYEFYVKQPRMRPAAHKCRVFGKSYGRPPAHTHSPRRDT